MDGRRHRVEASGSVSRRVQWYVDDELVAQKRSSQDQVELEAKDDAGLGAVAVRFGALGKPRRATLFEPGAAEDLNASASAVLGVGGLDLLPEPGSPAATYEDRVRANPQRYAVLTVLGGVAKVVVPILLAALVARIAVSLPLPDVNLPDLPWPDLPSIPWPSLPSIAWPDLPWPDWSLPGWLSWLLDNVHFVWPVVLAYVLARREIKRRAKQDRLRAERLRQHQNQE